MKNDHRYYLQRSTRYFEKYAKLNLECSYSHALSALEYGYHIESPDLQSDALRLGIEVTRAISNEEGLAHRFIERYFARNREESFENGDTFPYIRFNADVTMSEDIAFITAVEGVLDFKVHLQNLQKAVATKTEKLNRIYKKFDSNGLFIFTFNRALGEEEILYSIHAAEESLMEMGQGAPYLYDTFFINCVDRLYVVEGENIKSIPLKKELLLFLKNEALRPE